MDKGLPFSFCPLAPSIRPFTSVFVPWGLSVVLWEGGLLNFSFNTPWC